MFTLSRAPVSAGNSLPRRRVCTPRVGRGVGPCRVPAWGLPTCPPGRPPVPGLVGLRGSVQFADLAGRTPAGRLAVESRLAVSPQGSSRASSLPHLRGVPECLCVHMRLYTYACVRVCVHVCVARVPLQVSAHVCVCVCVCASAGLHMYVHVDVCLCRHLCMCLRVLLLSMHVLCVCALVCASMRVFVCVLEEKMGWDPSSLWASLLLSRARGARARPALRSEGLTRCTLVYFVQNSGSRQAVNSVLEEG